MGKEYKYGFRAKTGRDDLIIDWLESMAKSDKSYYIREALRDYLTNRSPQGSLPFAFNSSNQVKKKADRAVGDNSDLAELEISDSDLENNLDGWAD